MLSILADHNFSEHIVRGLQRRLPELDVAYARELGAARVPDEALLMLAEQAGRAVLTHDWQTMPAAVDNVLATGARVPLVIIVPRLRPIGSSIEDLHLLLTCGTDADLAGPYLRLPLR